MQLFFVTCAAGMLNGCGGIITVLRHDSVTTDYLSKSKSNCGAGSRVYIGVMFDFCVLSAQPADE
ncbi:hypothetical protein [Pseudomonas sp. TE3610]